MIVLLVLAVVVVGLVATFYVKKDKGDTFPGPKPHPIFGNVAQFDVKQFGTQVEKWSREYGTNYEMWMGPLNKLVVTADPALIKKIFVSRPAHFPRQKAFNQALLDVGLRTVANVEGDDWVRQRRLIAPSFTKFSVGNSFGYVNLCGKRFMKRWAKKSVAGEFIADNVQNEMQCFTLDVITLFAWAFDLNCTEQEDTQTQRDVLAYIDAIYRRMWNLTPLYKITEREAEKEFQEASNRLAGLLQTAINQGRKDGERSKSLLHALLDSDGLTDDEITRNSIGMLIGGLDTTSVTLTWLLWILSKHPEYQDKLKDEAEVVWGDLEFPTFEVHSKLTMADGAMKEALRIHSPAPVGQFLVDEDMIIDGKKVCAGTTLTTLTRLASAQFFKDPEVFRPERWMDNSDREVSDKYEPDQVSFFRSVFFGGGARICPGRNLALTEGSALLSAICRNYRIENVMTSDPYEIVSFVMQPTKVTLKFIPRI